MLLVVIVVIVRVLGFVVIIVFVFVEVVLVIVLEFVVRVEIVVVELVVEVQLFVGSGRVEVIGVRHISPKRRVAIWPPRLCRDLPCACQTDAMLRPVIAVVGPTAAGKSELSLTLARTLDGEVVNADSMQLYQGMDVGTAKLTPAERGDVVHHLLDIWPVSRAASVSEYQLLARRVIDDIRARGRTPILVGGSGLYVRAAIDNLQFPGTDADVRARLEKELENVGPGALHARLAELDPSAAAAILPSNGRRVVRALEVIELSGLPFSATLPDYQAVYPVVQVGVTMPRPELDQRIADRVARMWDQGLVAEVRRLEAPACARGGRRAGRLATRRC